MTTKPLSTQEMLENLHIEALCERAEASYYKRNAEAQHGLSPNRDPHAPVRAVHFNEMGGQHSKTAQTMETMAAILEVQSYPGFRHAKKAQGIFTIRLMLPNGKGGTLAEFRDANPVAAWLNAYEAIKGRESAVTPKGDEIV